LHLATHAQANDSLPIQSFIAFFPSKTDSITNSRMYLPEIYNLKLSNTRLTILSACETGSGRLIKGEGIISLARAFSYAGCPNMITSQWKADDLSTAYILHRVHHYLQKDMPVAKALAKAKRDYLDDSSIDGRKKTPAFFAHLRFTGQLETAGQTFNAWWLLAIPVLLIVYLFIKKTAAPTGDRQSHS
jgi:CHAT domain-containing protein